MKSGRKRKLLKSCCQILGFAAVSFWELESVLFIVTGELKLC